MYVALLGKAQGGQISPSPATVRFEKEESLWSTMGRFQPPVGLEVETLLLLLPRGGFPRAFANLARRDTKDFVKPFGKVGGIAISDTVCNFSNCAGVSPQKSHRAVKSHIPYEIRGRLISESREFPVKLRPAHSNFTAEIFNAEALIAHPLFNDCRCFSQEDVIN
jgi:hypothetical protein